MRSLTGAGIFWVLVFSQLDLLAQDEDDAHVWESFIPTHWHRAVKVNYAVYFIAEELLFFPHDFSSALKTVGQHNSWATSILRVQQWEPTYFDLKKFTFKGSQTG